MYIARFTSWMRGLKGEKGGAVVDCETQRELFTLSEVERHTRFKVGYAGNFS